MGHQAFAFLLLFVASLTLPCRAAVPPEVDKYLRLCEEKRIQRIFDRREHIAVLQNKKDAMAQPMTAEETRLRDELLKEIDSRKNELKELEDFDKPVHPLADISKVPMGRNVKTGDIYFRNFYGWRKFVVVQVVDAKHVLAETYLELKNRPPTKHSPKMLLEMPTKNLKVGDQIEPAGAWNLSAHRDKAGKGTGVIFAAPLDLRRYERHAAAIRKASLAEFLRREKEWLKKQRQIEGAAVPGDE